jgi:hypothetical protein
MDRLSTLFSQLTVTETARLLRRSALTGLVVGTVGLVVAATFGHALAGLGICIGLGVGLLNIRYVTRSVVELVEVKPERPRRILAGRSLGRLGITTIVVIGICLLSTSVGIGTFGGIALYYLVLVANVIIILLRPVRSGISS